jgi:hypothetical protein
MATRGPSPSLLGARSTVFQYLGAAGVGPGTTTAWSGSPSAPAEQIAVVERCNGFVKDTDTRCSRRAIGITGLCVQHRVFGCQAPRGGWSGDGEPIGRLHTVVGTRDGGLGCG